MWRDDAYLLDMLLAARKVMKYALGSDSERFEQDEVLQDAIMRRITIIGEAARKVSEEFKAKHPEIPWYEIAGMRNRLVHEYFSGNSGKSLESGAERYPRFNCCTRAISASGMGS